jgi:hypothetical protein
MYYVAEMDQYNAEHRRQLHFNFDKKQNTQKQRQSTEAILASQLRDIDLDAPPEQSMLVLPSKQHTLSRYILEDIFWTDQMIAASLFELLLTEVT